MVTPFIGLNMNVSTLLFKCGIFGHKKEQSPNIVQSDLNTTHPGNLVPTKDKSTVQSKNQPVTQEKPIPMPKPELEHKYGAWMLAQSSTKCGRKILKLLNPNHKTKKDTKEKILGFKLHVRKLTALDLMHCLTWKIFLLQVWGQIRKQIRL